MSAIRDAGAPERGQQEAEDAEAIDEAVAALAQHVMANPELQEAIVPLLPYVSRRVTLTNEEHQWAVAIKNAIVQTGEFTLTDFWYAQLAIIDKGDMRQRWKGPTKCNIF
ncbi:expressed unknown protein [Seminavis robusta]|uniref:Uncharacterized protein n=1 Tax=Seminavis robusta TaxID=568900 RepID=A0A9N8DBN2_9STRA|nr:expressed unknown protein [Seminavis robusta]|eukprot:Sro74_g040860.1 n/a (110) ;mRNA; f:92225-92554